jgi:hypothetical protein
MEKIGEEGRKNSALLRPIDTSTGNYGLTLAAVSKPPPKKNFAAAAAAGTSAGIKITPPVRAPAAQLGSKKVFSTPQSHKTTPVPKKQTSFLKPAVQDTREPRSEMTLDEARKIAAKFLKDQGIAEKTLAVFGDGSNAAIYFKHYKNRNGDRTLMYVNEDIMKHADSKQRRAIFLLKDKSREVHGITPKPISKARVNLAFGADEEEDDLLDLEFFGDGSVQEEEDDYDEHVMLNQGDLVELGPPDIDRRVWEPSGQDFRSLQQRPSNRRDQRQRDDYMAQEDYHGEAVKAREEFMRVKKKMMQAEQREQEASTYMARGSTNFERSSPRHQPTPWAHGGGYLDSSWLSQQPDMDTSSEPGWGPSEEDKMKSGRRRTTAGEEDDAASTSSRH